MAPTDASTPAPPKLLSLTVDDRETLYRSYMGFIQYGALFVPSDQPHHLGDPVFILLKLSFADSDERVSISGRVVWITPAGATGRRPQGVGVQFKPPESAELQRKFEALLAGHDATASTYTI